MTKFCYGCSSELTFNKFSKGLREKDKLQSKCKLCYRIYQAKRYLEKKEEINAINRAWYAANKKSVIVRTVAYKKQKRHSDPFFKAIVNLRRRLNRALKASKWQKNTKFGQYIGCSKQQLMTYLEAKFQPGMSWANYGEWHIDHKIPLSCAKSEKELCELSAYTNLQPLWALENIRKGNRVA